MRRKTVISRLTTLLLATLVCLLLAVLAPMFFAPRTTDEPFAGYAVMASPRDLHVITATIQLSDAPDLALTRGALYADGNAALGTAISRFVLDGPVFFLNASGPRAAAITAAASSFDTGTPASQAPAIAPLVEQLTAMSFDVLTIRRGTLHVTSADGSWENISDIQAELSGRRKGQVSARGSFVIRGQRLNFDTTVTLPADKRAPPRWPVKLSLKGGLLDASFDGHLDVAEDLQLAGQTEIASPSLRRAARWFGVPISTADGLNATSLKGRVNWAGRTLAVEKAKITIDGNEATGALALSMGGERPLIDATLAFSTLDVTPYADAARSQSFVFDRLTASWSLFDLSFPLIKHVDADVRVSAPKVTLKGYAFGRGAATITVRAGKLLADIAELELSSGIASARVTANANGLVPRYEFRGKIENFEAGLAGTALFGAPIVTGRSTLALDIAGSGQTPAELLRRLSGKASLTMADGARMALDVKALRAATKAGGSLGWGALAKGQTSLEQVEARALIRDGVVITELLQARSGGMGLAASGRVDLSDRTLDLRLAVKPNAPSDRPLKAGDLTDAEAVTVRGSWQQPFVRGADDAAADAPR